MILRERGPTFLREAFDMGFLDPEVYRSNLPWVPATIKPATRFIFVGSQSRTHSIRYLRYRVGILLVYSLPGLGEETHHLGPAFGFTGQLQ